MFQYNREKQYKTKELESILNNYTDFVNSFIEHNNIYFTENFSKLDSIVKLFPRSDIRITVIDTKGIVLYDSFFLEHESMENHIARPEIQKALVAEKGTNIRLSESTNQDFYYYAKLYDSYFVRSAVVYGLSIKEFLKVESLFIYFIVFLFLITSGILLFITDKIGKAILKLKDFAVKASENQNIDMKVTFPENELGAIGKQILNIYNNLKETNIKLEKEKEKLIQHLQISQEGIAFFSKSDEKILANNHFIQFLNLISDKTIIGPDNFLKINEFRPIKEFIEKNIKDENLSLIKTLPVKRISIEKNMRYFNVQCFIFQDRSYEVSINEVTTSVKQKKLKQEMTSNIAHELRTPVSSIKGYLETILQNENIAPEKQKYFIEKAFLQIERLSELIRDIALLTKIEEASDLFKIEKVEIDSVIYDVIENLHSRIVEAKASVKCNFKEKTIINGNKALIYSIFQNLLENSLNYGGNNIEISIDKYFEDENNVLFSFSDNGIGIGVEHLSRVFERFYRVDEGRSRDSGGTGLGLAIVKNAVQLHKGEISLKNRKQGGIEIIFSLKKNYTDF